MKTALEYLREAKEKLGCESDYQLAKALKTSTVNISNYMNNKSIMDDYHCLVVAKALGIDPMRIIAAAQEEREKNPEKQGVWRDFRVAREREKGRAIVPMMAALTGLMMMVIMTIASQAEWPIVLHTLKLCELRKRLRKVALRTNTMLSPCNIFAMQNA